MEKPKTNTAVPIGNGKKLKIPHTFEIMVEEMHELDDGTIQWRPVMADPRLGGNGQIMLTVNSPEELKEKQQWYERAGQRFKIIREINPPSKADIERMAAEQGFTIPSKDKLASKPAATASAPEPVSVSEDKPKRVSKIINIGDVQIKYDGDSVYQKQWVRLSPHEEANIRVVNSINNKLVPMKGRHFEVKRWVKVEGGSVFDEPEEIL